MNPTLLLLALLLALPLGAQEKATEKQPDPAADKAAKAMEKHRQGAEKLSEDQDELAADVQRFIDGQANEKIIKLLEETEELMGEATDNLEDARTDGETLAIETEIIEKIYEAAKEKSR